MMRINLILIPGILFFLIIGKIVSAEAAKLASIDPLPDDQIEILFNKISQHQEIETLLLQQALQSNQTYLRALAAQELGKKNDWSAVPSLIDALSDESYHEGAEYAENGGQTTRYWANKSLIKITKIDFHFIWNDPLEKRNQAIDLWKQWYLSQPK
jgi:HEAT repeat protein